MPISYKAIIKNIVLAGALPFFDHDSVTREEYERNHFLRMFYKFDLEKYHKDEEYKSEILKKVLLVRSLIEKNGLLIEPKEIKPLLEPGEDFINDEVVRYQALFKLKSETIKSGLPESEKIRKLEYIRSAFLLPIILRDIDHQDGLIYNHTGLQNRLKSRGYQSYDNTLDNNHAALEAEMVTKNSGSKEIIEAHFKAVKELKGQLLMLDYFDSEGRLSFYDVCRFIDKHCLKMLIPDAKPHPSLAATFPVLDKSKKSIAE